MAPGRSFRIVVACHGDLAAALLASTEMICGHLDDAVAVGLTPHESPEGFAEALDAAIGSDDRPVLIIVDLTGGTPYNVASAACRRLQAAGRQTACVSGANLGMLLEAATSLGSISEGAVAGLVSAGQAGVADVTRRPEKTNA